MTTFSGRDEMARALISLPSKQAYADQDCVCLCNVYQRNVYKFYSYKLMTTGVR